MTDAAPKANTRRAARTSGKTPRILRLAMIQSSNPGKEAYNAIRRAICQPLFQALPGRDKALQATVIKMPSAMYPARRPRERRRSRASSAMSVGTIGQAYAYVTLNARSDVNSTPSHRNRRNVQNAAAE